MQPSQADNAIAPLQSSEVIEFSLEQPVSQSSGIGVQAAEAKSTTIPTAISIEANPMMVIPSNAKTSSVTASGANGDCGCGGGSKQVQIAYALGELGYDYGTQARRDSFTQAIPQGMILLDYLEQNPWEAQSLIWTLNLDATPIYAIAPVGPYASVTYERLRSFLGDENIERVSIPGYIGGSIKLMSGQTVPAIIPEVRGLFSWTAPALIDSLMETTPTESASREAVTGKLREYLERIYYEYRNLGITPQERALNFSATNAFQVATLMADATTTDLGLDSITVEKSPICRPDSDCYDVKLKFFNLEDNRRSGKVYRFTIDVSDVLPVSIGTVRSWSIAS